MLIYNHKKEFIGIDESDLKALGFSNLAELQHEAADFADLFTKSVGYIYNFKHVHWIDYVACDDSGAKQKVTIRAKSKNFVASLDIQTIYLSDSPSQKAYIINLVNIKALLDSSSTQTREEPIARPVPKVELPTNNQITENYDSKQVSYASDLDIEKDLSARPSEAISLPIDIDISKTEQEDKKYALKEEPKVSKPLAYEAEHIIQVDDDINEFADYRFSPNTASEALGLPVDLIEEFIQDFIAQANSFKVDLYQAAEDKDITKLKILSHKLKGVAANLRIEDALSILTSIGVANEHDDMIIALNKLFKILDKLSSKEDECALVTQEYEKMDDDFILSFKDQESPSVKDEKAKEKTIEINDSQVPDTIEIAELADDDFYKQHKGAVKSNISDEELSILDTVLEEDSSDMEEDVLDIAISYDKGFVADSIGLDTASFSKLLEEYLEISHELCESIAVSMENSDFNSSKEDAIELKGMSDNMRIHKFDDELNTIINSNDTEEVMKNISVVMAKLNQISNIEGK